MELYKNPYLVKYFLSATLLYINLNISLGHLLYQAFPMVNQDHCVQSVHKQPFVYKFVLLNLKFILMEKNYFKK